MTLEKFERLVLRLANQMPTRYWKHFNYPEEAPWFMALQIRTTEGETPADIPITLRADLIARGGQWRDLWRVWTFDRTNDDGTPFRLSTVDSPSTAYSYEAAEAYACKVCGNRPDADGILEHGRGCYTLDPDGGGSEWVETPWSRARG